MTSFGLSPIFYNNQLFPEIIFCPPDLQSHRRFLLFAGDLNHLLGDSHVQLLPLPQQGVAQFIPCLGEVRADPQLVAQHPQPAEAPYHALPQPAVGGGVDAGVGGMGVVVVQVDEAGFAEHLVAQLRVADVRGQDGVGGQGQAGIVEAPGLVVVPAGQLHLMGEQLLQQQEQHHHIRLLGHLNFRNLLLIIVLTDASHMGLALVLGQVDVLQGQVGAVLGQDAILVGLGEDAAPPRSLPTQSGQS